MARRTLVIVNPRGAGGATGRRWTRIAERLCAALGSVEVEHTRAPRDAERLAREGVRAGVERVVVAGGDGTLSEVVTGLLAADLAGYAEIGVLPLGTAADFARSLGVPRELDRAIACLVAGRVRPIDAGRVTYRSVQGAERISYWVNVASFGASALACQMLNRSPRLFGATFSFLFGALRAILRYRSAHVTIRVDGALVHDAPLTFAAVANGRCFGAGMRLAPDARLDDGLFDVVIVSGLSTVRRLIRLPGIYRGAHLADAATALHRGTVVEAAATSGAVLLELDGEPLGTLPAHFELLPGALSMIGPRA
jgi:YegS/Rv2252/BmrU family lipid kinase